MNEHRKSRGRAVVIVVAGVLLLVLYVAGYFGLGEYDQMAIGVRRWYPHSLVARLYYPAAVVEAKFINQPVALVCDDREIDLLVRP